MAEENEIPGMNDQEVDALVDRVDAKSTASAPEIEEQERTEPAQPEQFEFTHNGKKIQGNREQIIKWAQMGYDRPQWQQKFNQERTKFETDRKTFEQKWEEHRKIDAWASQNPDKWSSIVNAFKNQGQTTAQANASANALNPEQIRQIIQSELKQNPLVSEVLTEHQQAREKAADDALDQTIREIREKYKDLDFDALNDQGLSLEKQIIDHAIKNGINSFSTAFRDYCYDQLEARAIAQAKSSITKTTQSNSKLGILGKTTSSRAGSRLSAPKNIRDTSYEDLAAEGLAELRQTS